MKQGPGVLLLLFFAVFHSGAQTTGVLDVSKLPDTYEARARYLNSVVTANWNSAVLFPETYLQTSTGRVQISIDRQDDYFFVRFLGEREGAYPLASPGNVVVQRNYLRNGDLIQAKIFLSSDPSCYIRLYPYSERSKADVVLYGAVVRQGIILGQLFYYQLRDPLARILETTKNSVDWGMLYGAPGSQSAVRRFSRTLNEGRLSSGSAAGRLVSGLASEDSVERFLAGQPRSPETAELGESPSFPFADDRDPRATSPYKAFPRYESERGVPLAAAGALVHAESLKDADMLVAAFVQGDGLSRRILLLPAFDSRGVFGLEAYDPSSRTFLDWAEFVALHRGARVRLVRMPAPQP